jgi:hypothetical protein
LFHGPGSDAAALAAAESYGRLIIPPLGSGCGPRKEDARTVASLYRRPPASDRRGCIVIGPMDLATDEAADALLKMVEEPNPDAMPFLWASDAGSVRPTIRSRCIEEWCPGEAAPSHSDTGGLTAGLLLTPPVCSREVYDLLLAKGTDFPALVESLAAELSPDIEAGIPGALELWDRIRETLGRESRASVAAALIGGVE